MVAVNLLAMSAIGLLGGMFAQAAGRHALWGVLLAGYFGLFSSLGRDLTEPVAAACMLGALLALRRGRPVLAGLALAYAALTRETVLIVAGAIFLGRLSEFARRRARPGTADLAWLLPALAFGAWQLVLRQVTGGFTLLASLGSNGTGGLPFSAFLHAVRVNTGLVPSSTLADIWFLEVATLLIFAITAATALRATMAPAHERIAFVVFVVELGFLSHYVWAGLADLRSINEVYLFSVLVLFAAPRRRLAPLALCALITLVAAAGYQVLNI